MTEPMSEREIAKAMGISRAMVRKIAARALRKIGANPGLRRAVELAMDDEHRKAKEESFGEYAISRVGGKKYRARQDQ